MLRSVLEHSRDECLVNVDYDYLRIVTSEFSVCEMRRSCSGFSPSVLRMSNKRGER